MVGGDGKSRLYFDFLKTSDTSKEPSFKPLFVFMKENGLFQSNFHFGFKTNRISKNDLRWCQTKVTGEVMVAFADT